jgi:hypothetical protein
MKMRTLLRTAALAGLTLWATANAQAGTITRWDMINVTVTPPPYTLYETYDSTLFTTPAKTASNGAVIWKESDVQAPGLKVVTGDDVTGENCLMTTGYNPNDGTTKMCSDPFQESKRWKTKAYKNEPVDVYFSVLNDGVRRPYRSLAKLSNATTGRLEGFTIELGFMVNGTFVPSTAGDGLGFSDRSGKLFTGTVLYDPLKKDILSATFAQGLAGPADEHHAEPGYFFPTEPMYLDLKATEDKIESTGISANHMDKFGYWHSSYDVPLGFFYDDDQDPNTDNILMANCEWAFNPLTLACGGEWVTYRSCIGLDAYGEPCVSDGIRKVVPAATVNAWLADPWWNPGYIDDFANLTLNYFITVDRRLTWPTPGQFVVRMRTVPAPTAPPVVQADVAITAVTLPAVKLGQTGNIAVTLNNKLAGAASGTLNLLVTDLLGGSKSYSVPFTTTTNSTSSTFTFSWTAPKSKTTVTATAAAVNVAGEINPADNTKTVSKAYK